MTRTSPAATSDRALIIDTAALLIVAAAIVTVSQHLLFMSVLVPVVVLLRFVFWSRLPAGERLGFWPELLFFGLCTGLGAFNDWMSVDIRQIYDYDVPAAFPDVSSIPFWMLLYWGVILRFVASLGAWQRLSPPAGPRDDVHLPGRVVRSPAARIAFLLLLVFATRSRIYRDFGDPIWSWVPFALAMVVYVAFARPRAHDLRLAGLFLLGGPVVEAAFIQLGGLHRYHHGILGGVPVWIALWWVLAVLVWKDLSAYLTRALARAPVTQ